jgi:polyprenyl P-hydroxybenzoate/phenylacrylic acid decarboxylase-like protein
MPYALALLRRLVCLEVELHVIVTADAWQVMRLELDARDIPPDLGTDKDRDKGFLLYHPVAHVPSVEPLAASSYCADKGALDFGLYYNKEFTAGVASGSFATQGMVVVPASLNTLAKVAHGMSDNLLTRAAEVTLKEKRRLILLPRETPLSLNALRNMEKAAEAGAIVAPAAPGFYHKPKSVAEVFSFMVDRILGLMDLADDTAMEWGFHARQE